MSHVIFWESSLLIIDGSCNVSATCEICGMFPKKAIYTHTRMRHYDVYDCLGKKLE